MSFYKEDIDMTYLEVAVLLEDIILPELPPFPTLEEIESGNVYYPRTEELYTDTIGKFSVPIINPLGDNSGDPVNDEKSGGSARNIVNSNCNIEVNSYQKSNYLELNIPKYILLNFLRKVPAGTIFLVGFIGGDTSVGDIRIVGVSEYDASSVEN